jgi:hypothetical protein
MTMATTDDLRVRLLDRLRHAEQYFEAARLAVEDALRLVQEAELIEEGGDEGELDSP